MSAEESDSLRNATSSEVDLKNQSSPEKSTVTQDGEEKAIHLRFLLSNSEAGSIIGKGGSTINDIQSKSGARIQLSRNYEHFPGTSDRIVMVSGLIGYALKAIELIVSKLLDEFYAEEEGNENDPESRIRLIVPNSSCGGLIGKGGAVIRSLIEESQAAIKVSPQDNYYPGVHDRLVTVNGTLTGLVTVTGTLTEQMRAIDLILLKLAEDQYYQQSATSVYPYAAPLEAFGRSAAELHGRKRTHIGLHIKVCCNVEERWERKHLLSTWRILSSEIGTARDSQRSVSSSW